MKSLSYRQLYINNIYVYVKNKKHQYYSELSPFVTWMAIHNSHRTMRLANTEFKQSEIKNRVQY